jgi:RNA polymerase sigma-70 factor (ECF subfamily)
LVDEATTILEAAMRRRTVGPYQLQAAIAALHATASSFESTAWDRIIDLYDVLIADQGDAVIALNRAAAIGHHRGAAAGLAAIDAMPEEHLGRLADYPYFHACRGEFQAAIGELDLAGSSLRRATELTSNAAERAHLRARIDAIADDRAAVVSRPGPASDDPAGGRTGAGGTGAGHQGREGDDNGGRV